MIFTPLEPISLTLLNGSFQPMGTGREPGLHLSDILGVMKEAAGFPTGPIPGEENSTMRPQLGFLWEQAQILVTLGYSVQDAMDIVWKRFLFFQFGLEDQPKLQLDGVHMTPDAFFPELGRIDSYKLTWKSMRKWEEDPEEHFWPWIVAEKSYLWAFTMQENRDILECRFVVCWVNGDYGAGLKTGRSKIGSGPQATQCTMICTREELEENWKNVLRHKGAVR